MSREANFEGCNDFFDVVNEAIDSDPADCDFMLEGAVKRLGEIAEDFTRRGWPITSPWDGVDAKR